MYQQKIKTKMPYEHLSFNIEPMAYQEVQLDNILTKPMLVDKNISVDIASFETKIMI